MRNVGKRDNGWDNLHTFGFEEGRSATEIPTAIRLMAAAAQEGELIWVTLFAQSMYNVSPESLNLVTKEMGIAPMLAGAILRN